MNLFVISGGMVAYLLDMNCVLEYISILVSKFENPYNWIEEIMDCVYTYPDKRAHIYSHNKKKKRLY